MDVLEFIAKMHKEVVKLLSERAFEDPSEEIGQEESEEETSEDWDWI